MLKFLKKYFIPHKENDHRPHILRAEATLVAVSFLIVIELLFLAGAGVFTNYDRYFASILSGVLVDETNTNRISQNLLSLKVSLILAMAAQEKAEDMARVGYFSHVGPDGKTPWDWFRDVGYEYRYAGENLAVNFIDSKDVVDAWMNSPGHRANILNGRYTEIGIGTATGTYKGRETVFIAQYFGRPLFAAKPSSISTSPTPLLITKTSPTPVNTSKLETLPSSTYQGRASSPQKSVLGESVGTNQMSLLQEEKFVSIENPNSKDDNLEMATNAGSSIPTRQSSILEHALASPRSIVSRLLIVLAIIFTLALLLKIFIKIEIQHPPLIINGLILIVLIVSALILNKYIGFVSAQVL